MLNWYPKNKEELDELLEKFLETEQQVKEIHGVIVPHAGYEYSGKIAGKAFALLKNKGFEKAIIFGPSHQFGFYGIAKIPKIKTPFGEPEIINSEIKELHGLNYEHSIDNQIPFLQKIGINKILPIVVGQLSLEQSKKIAEEILKFKDDKTIFVFSTDLSHFFDYETAIERDLRTIKIIENLEIEKAEQIDACGVFPLLIMMNICKIKKWKPKLIEYKNSGDIIGEKTSVVGYSSFWF